MKDVFLNRMKAYLQEEYDAFYRSLQEPFFRGLRMNSAKIEKEAFANLHVCEMKPTSICEEAFYVPHNVQGLGNHPAHLAGLYYIQEPSASSAVEVLDVQSKDWVLDVCAAPGGKSTQIGAKLHPDGFLVCNEIDEKRARILLSNMERLGFSECMITNAHPKELCKRMKGWFDKVLVDAPCSGEGMFKKHAKALETWSLEHVNACAQRQALLLDSAYDALKEGGILVYSTCTYAIEENEQVIYNFLQSHPAMELIDAGGNFGRNGLDYRDLDSTKVRRIYPMDEGEGHFIAKMKKCTNQHSNAVRVMKNTRLASYVSDRLQEQIGHIPPYHIVLQNTVYVKQTPFLQLDHIHILRQGTQCGHMIKNRFEPHQHLYTSCIYEKQLRRVYEMSQEECLAYVAGNVLEVPGYKGYVALTWKGHPIGFAKGDNDVLKNKYPKGMRVLNR